MSEDRLYHLVEKVVWEACLEFKEPYYPTGYEKDGFIHLTADPSLLLTVANAFCQHIEGDWMCLVLDPSKLKAEIKYEGAVPDRLIDGRPSPIWEDTSLKFPHLYGTIDFDAVLETLDVIRSHCGRFVAIEGLPEASHASVDGSGPTTPTSEEAAPLPASA